MEIIDRDEESGEALIQIAFADTREEAALIRGLLREAGIKSLAQRAAPGGRGLAGGLTPRSPQRVYVRADTAAAARTLLGETMVEEPAEEIPESANAAHLAAAAGGGPRDYSAFGAYVRATLVALLVLGLALAAFLVLR